MRIPVVMGHEAEDEGQLIDFLAQPPLWSDAGIGWGSSLERLFNFIGTNTRREVTPNDERQRYSKVVVQISAECPGWVGGCRLPNGLWITAFSFNQSLRPDDLIGRLWPI